MIFTKNKSTHIVLGHGTVGITNHEGTCPSIELANCSKTEIGEVPKKLIKAGKVKMLFKNEESVDVLIKKLNHIKLSFKRSK